MTRVFALALAALLASTGCTTIKGWFVDDDPEAPAELVDFEPAIDVRRNWKTSVGSGVDRAGRQLKPVYATGTVFGADYKGRLAAIASETGDVRWQVKTDLSFSGGPAVDGDLLVIGTMDGEVLAFDAGSGAERWRSRVSSEVLARPAIADGQVFVRSIDGRVFAFDAGDGERNWVYDHEVPLLTLRGNADPIARGGALFVGYDGGQVVALRQTDGGVLWEQTVVSPEGRTELERLADVDGQMVLVASDLIVPTYKSRLASLAASSGQLLWFEDIASATGVSVDRTNLAISDTDGTLWLLDRRNGSTLWQHDQLARRGLTRPTFYRDLIVVGDREGYLHWYRVDDGRLVARTDLGGGGFAAAPVTIGNTLLALTRDGDLFALSADGGEG